MDDLISIGDILDVDFIGGTRMCLVVAAAWDRGNHYGFEVIDCRTGFRGSNMNPLCVGRRLTPQTRLVSRSL